MFNSVNQWCLSLKGIKKTSLGKRYFLGAADAYFTDDSKNMAFKKALSREAVPGE